MVENEKRTRGRPSKRDARHYKIDVRLSSKEVGRVRTIADTYGVSPSEAMRIALNQYYEKLF